MIHHHGASLSKQQTTDLLLCRNVGVCSAAVPRSQMGYGLVLRLGNGNF